MKKMKTHSFTLVLKDVHEHTPNLEDSLYEAGCDDALIHFRHGAVYLDFDRKAVSLEEAVISAIREVKSASVDAHVLSVAPENLVTESEIAKRLNKSRQLVSLWIKGERRQSFPHPVMRLAHKSALWKWSEVATWAYQCKMIDNKELLDNALFLEHIHAVLEECDKKTRDIRHGLLRKIEAPYQAGAH